MGRVLEIQHSPRVKSESSRSAFCIFAEGAFMGGVKFRQEKTLSRNSLKLRPLGTSKEKPIFSRGIRHLRDRFSSLETRKKVFN